MGWLAPTSKEYDGEGQWLWGKLMFLPKRGKKALSRTPTTTDPISLDSIIYAAQPYGRTRYALAGRKDRAGGGQAGEFLTCIEFLEESIKATSGQGEGNLDMAELERRLQEKAPAREIDVNSDEESDDLPSDVDEQ